MIIQSYLATGNKETQRKTFEVKVYKAIIEPHPDPEVHSIELCRIGDYISIVKKNQIKPNDLVAYLPEASIVPAPIVEALGLTGKLFGPDKNRIKAIKLRKVLSQGLVYVAPHNAWIEGQDVQEELGITKWEPPIPPALRGAVGNGGLGFTFDVENIKKNPNIFQDGEEVIFTEKIHGTCFIATLYPKDLRREDMIEGKLAVISKGLGKQNLYFKDIEENASNVYLRAAKKFNLAKGLDEFFVNSIHPIRILGEVYGDIQDLKYGYKPGQIDLRVFGLNINGQYQDWQVLEGVAKELKLPLVPVLYRGPFSKEVMLEYTKGKETISGDNAHMREGIVIYPVKERIVRDLGRVILKSVSEDYLLRGNGKEEGTEFN